MTMATSAAVIPKLRMMSVVYELASPNIATDLCALIDEGLTTFTVRGLTYTNHKQALSNTRIFKPHIRRGDRRGGMLRVFSNGKLMAYGYTPVLCHAIAQAFAKASSVHYYVLAQDCVTQVAEKRTDPRTVTAKLASRIRARALGRRPMVQLTKLTMRTVVTRFKKKHSSVLGRLIDVRGIWRALRADADLRHYTILRATSQLLHIRFLGFYRSSHQQQEVYCTLFRSGKLVFTFSDGHISRDEEQKVIDDVVHTVLRVASVV
jgi:hypothetical protein